MYVRMICDKASRPLLFMLDFMCIGLDNCPKFLTVAGLEAGSLLTSDAGASSTKWVKDN